MKKIINLGFVFLVVFFTIFSFANFYINPAFAQEEIPESEKVATLLAETEEETLAEDTEDDTDDIHFQIQESIILKNGCVVEDKDGNKHIFPATTGPEYLAICAFQEALEQGFVDNIEFMDFGFGLFVNSVNAISQENTYWKLNLNGVGSSVGVSELELRANDIVSFILTAFDPETFEEEALADSLTLTITSLDPAFNNILLTDNCSVDDIDGNKHTFPQEDSPSEFLGICALTEALEQGFIESFELKNNPDFGLFVQSINGTAPSETEFWALWKNGEFADCGISCLALTEGDTLSLILTDWMTESEGAKTEFRIIKLISTPEEEKEEGAESEEEIPPPSTGGGGGGGNSTPIFNTINALAYLKSTQGADGSFGGSPMYTDWTAIAFGALNETSASRDLLLAYLRSNNTISSLLTDNERRAMALLALGENPYSFNGINYINVIIDSFDGTQFGDIDLVNDDIFALIPLSATGYTSSDNIINKTVGFVISKQASNGSWVNSVDITATSIQALKSFESIAGVPEALAKATDYLTTSQNTDGGWENVSSTSWVIQAQNALDASWIKNGKGGIDYLATQQEADGAVSPSTETLANRIWATSYALTAASGKTWNEIMQSVSKSENKNAAEDVSNDDLPENSEDAGTEAIVEPVICPAPDLFSTITGEACTETAPTDFEIPPTENIEKITSPIPEKITALSVNLNIDEEEENTLEINPSDLSASVINSVSPNYETSIFSRSWKAISIVFSICARFIVKIMGF